MSFLNRANIGALIQAAGVTSEDLLQASRSPVYARQVAARLLKQGEVVAKDTADTVIEMVAHQLLSYFEPPPAVVESLFGASARMQAYKTLGLDFGPGEMAPLKIAESVYRHRVMTSHPDRHQGLTEAELRVLTERQQLLNEAIEYIRQEHKRGNNGS